MKRSASVYDVSMGASTDSASTPALFVTNTKLTFATQLMELFTASNFEQLRNLVAGNPKKALFAAIEKDINLTKWILEEFKAVANETDKDGNTCLHLAVIANNTPLVTFISVNYPALALYQNTKGWTPLHLAVLSSNFQLFIQLLRENRDFAQSDIISRVLNPFLSEKFIFTLKRFFYENPTSFMVIKNGYVSKKSFPYDPNCLKIIKHLLKVEPSANDKKDTYNKTPLLWCVQFYNYGVLKCYMANCPEALELKTSNEFTRSIS
ncbi:MAG: ankyrin repeat domain-containing protein [Gammaproteobacteria bacterium]